MENVFFDKSEDYVAQDNPLANSITRRGRTFSIENISAGLILAEHL